MRIKIFVGSLLVMLLAISFTASARRGWHRGNGCNHYCAEGHYRHYHVRTPYHHHDRVITHPESEAVVYHKGYHGYSRHNWHTHYYGREYVGYKKHHYAPRREIR